MNEKMNETPFISLQRAVRVFIAKYHLNERRVAIANTEALKTNSPLIGMIVVYNFDNKMGIVLYKEIDKQNRLKVNFVFLLKSYLPAKYIPHRDYVTFELIENPRKKDKLMARIISITARSVYSYKNLLEPIYNGKLARSNAGDLYVNFKYHQMSYRTKLNKWNALNMKLQDANNQKLDEVNDVNIMFKLDRSFRAIIV
tara:strand:- start:100 stop:696 length:597 start_codon:yes stop_codon:yes gene_type:complete